ncbi:MAG TPA: SAF domain-containing protein [Longimicrobium sp.]|jgi:hypothetical protein|nr:SAF domain-containing protein [Longimicrobium sp.]
MRPFRRDHGMTLFQRVCPRRFFDRLGRLDGVVEANERKALEDRGLHTRSALAARVAKTGLTATAKAPVERAHLRKALAAYVVAEVNGKAHPLPARVIGELWASRRELVLVALIGLAAYGVVRALGRPERHVVAARDLAPFQVIGPADVKADDADVDFGVYASPADVVGRVPLHVIGEGDPLRKDDLSRVSFAQQEGLDGRRIVSLTLPEPSAALAVPRSRVTLLLSPRSGAPPADSGGAVVTDVIVLASRMAGDTSSIVVAVGEGDLGALARLLGRTQVTVVQPVSLSSH